MLNESRVLRYIKDNLGFPFQVLEKTDEEIIQYVQEYTIREWSEYIPEPGKILVLDIALDRTKVPGKQNEFYLEEPQGLEIIDVVDVYYNMSDLLIHGHMPIGPLSHGDLAGWALSTQMAVDLKQFSSFDKTFIFRHPNVLRISPVFAVGSEKWVGVEYERMQPKDFSGIPNEFQTLFCEFALADIMIQLGRIRRRYSDLKTPFGDIPISPEIFDEGSTKKKDILDRLINGTLTNVVLDFQ
jgi:hypothetical protein